MDIQENQIAAAWKQTSSPVVYRPGEKGRKLRVRLPFHESNRLWLSAIGRTAPEWMKDKRSEHMKKSKTLKVGIASYEDMKQRTLAIARGELKPSADDPKVWFTSPENFARLLSNRNRELLSLIIGTHLDSLQELAESSGRQVSNLSRTLKTM